MTWTYQMNFQTVKEANTALRKIKGTRAQKTYYFRMLFPLITILFLVFILPVLKRDFDLGSSLFSAVFAYPIVLIAMHFGRKRVLKKQLPAYYRASVENGILTEDLTTKDGTASNCQHPLTELLEAVPFRSGLLLRFSSHATLFLPQAAFTQSTPQQSAAFILNAASLAKSELPRPDSVLPKETEDTPAYGTLYFELPESHVYPLFKQCNLYINRNPFISFGRAMQKNRKIFILFAIFFGISFLWAAFHNPSSILPTLTGILIFFLCVYIFTLLLVHFACYQIKKENRLITLCGPQYIAFYEKYLFLQRRQNSQKVYYREFSNLYEAKDVYFLLQKETSALIMIPKWAFASQQEETMFIRTLKGRLRQ